MSKKQLEKQENKALEAIAEYNACIDALIDNLRKCTLDADSIPKVFTMREAMSKAEQYGMAKIVGKLWNMAYDEVTRYNEIGLTELRKHNEQEVD